MPRKSGVPVLSPREGVTLLEVVVTIAILATIAGIVALSVEASSAVGGEAKRADDAARKLLLIRDAAVRWNQGGRNDSSFTYAMSGGLGNVNPGRLSELYDSANTTTDRNSCGAVLTAARWMHAFTHFPLPKTDPRSTYVMAPGYVALDSLVRFDTLGAVTTALSIGTTSLGYDGTLAIVMPNVSLSDAQRLEARMEGTHDHRRSSPLGVVRFDDTDPTTVYFHMAIHGC
jgi:prepilin-type N-terminal cleavage/methylation domain-containing protein